MESLDQMVNFSIAVGNNDLNRGVLNADTLIELLTFSMTRRRELAGQQFRHQKQLEQLDGQLKRAGWQRKQAAGSQRATNYQAMIFAARQQSFRRPIQLHDGIRP